MPKTDYHGYVNVFVNAGRAAKGPLQLNISLYWLNKMGPPDQ